MHTSKSPFSPRLIAILLTGVVVVTAIAWFVNNYLYRSRAGGGGATIALTQNVNVAAGEEFNLPVTFSVDSGIEVIGADLVLSFNPELLEVVDLNLDPAVVTIFSLLPQDTSGAFDKARVIQNANSTGLVEIGAVSDLRAANPPAFTGSATVGSVRFKAKQNGGASVTVLFTEGSTTDSNIVSRDNVDVLVGVTNSTVTIGSGGVTLTEGPSPTGGASCTTAADCEYPQGFAQGCAAKGCVSGQCVFTPENEGQSCSRDGSPFGSCLNGNCVQTSGTGTPAVTATPTQAPGNTNVTFKLKFQGITQRPRGENAMDVKIALATNAGNGAADVSVGDRVVRFTSDENGVWTGTTRYDVTTTSGTYRAYIKGPRHLQKKVCTGNPTEQQSGAYRCATAGFTVTSGESNTLDFTGIQMVVGDFPDAAGAQNGVIDREDIALITQNFSSTDPAILRRADINMDGVINVLGDYIYLIDALSVRFDE